nr:hypothetical protein [Tanacetum cinerariifolium]
MLISRATCRPGNLRPRHLPEGLPQHAVEGRPLIVTWVEGLAPCDGILGTHQPSPYLVPIPSEFKGIPDTMCDVHLVNSSTPLEAKDHFEIIINSNDDYSSSDDDSLYYDNIEYVEASPYDSEFVSLEVEKIVIPEDKEIEDDNLREKLLKVNLLIAKIKALKDNPTPSSEFLTNSGSTTTQSDISFPEYKLFIFDLLNDQFPPTDRSDFTHEEFDDEPAHIISPPEYDCFYFGNFPDPGELISILTYLVIPPHLYLFGNEDTIFDPGITINRLYSFKPGLSHRYGTFKKFNTHRSHLNESPMEMLFSNLCPMDQ